MASPKGLNFTMQTCVSLPPDITSGGLMKQFHEKNYKWLDYASPRLQLLIVLIFALTQSVHFVLKRFGLPLFTSQVIAGLMISRAVLPKKLADNLITNDNVQLLVTIGEVGYSFFVFLSAVKMDIGMVIRVGRKAWYTGFLSVATPFVAVTTSLLSGASDQDIFSCLFLLPLLFMTSFPVIHGLLTETKIINSELGRLASSSAIIGEFASFNAVIVLSAMKASINEDLSTSLKGVGYVALFVFIILLVLRPIILLLVKLTPEGRPVSQTSLQAVIFLFLIVTLIMPEDFTQFWAMVLYLIGLAVPHGPPLGSALVEKFESMVSAIFLPLFITTCAMRSEKLFPNFYDSHIREKAMIAVITLFAKFFGCFVPLLYNNKMHKHDAFLVAAILSSKGVTELEGFAVSFDRKFINADVFSLMVLFVTFMASIVPILVQKFYDPSRKYAGYQIRKIMDSKPETQLHMIACIHLPNNVSAVLNLLDISCPTTETPIAVSVLHLVKIRGLAASMFVSHQKQGKNPAYSYSENVVLSFKKFEANHWGAASMNVFTAISPPDNFMDDDICTLALDKLASLIILPFHRTWYIDGSLESEDPNIRNLNCKVLEKAPCSVGILIDPGNMRRPMNHESSPTIAMLFLGGRDDREAVTFAYRMAQDSRVNLTVAHFIARSEDYEVNWEVILDSEVLRDIKSNDSVTYITHIVEEGRETIRIIQSMVNDYDLIIVGRRYNVESPQTAGLKEWSEYPELGALGDLLGSKDLNGKCSVLVVQQQAAIH